MEFSDTLLAQNGFEREFDYPNCAIPSEAQTQPTQHQVVGLPGGRKLLRYLSFFAFPEITVLGFANRQALRETSALALGSANRQALCETPAF